MDAAWVEFLRGANGAEHAAQVYESADELAATVAAYLAVGLATGEPGILIARAEHRPLFESMLAGCGWDVDRVLADGLLVIVDAEETLVGFLGSTGPDPERFDAVVGGLVAAAAARHPGKRIRAFGEMVDVLCERGRVAAAGALEELWTGLATQHRFSLLCAYHRRVLDQGALAEVCRIHTQVRLPA
jgi:hypothetical protein